MNEIREILKKYNPVYLSDIEQVRLMNRIDRKYWFHLTDLPEVLKNLTDEYNILEINGERLMVYETTYYDTDDDLMYRLHHNRKLNRYKIRKRRYLSTGDDFLEIKLKNNKRRTVKQRIKSEDITFNITEKEALFIGSESPYLANELVPVINNRFRRITLVNKNNTDRCTIDMNLEFKNHRNNIIFDDLVIVEIKRGRSLKSSPLLLVLREKKIRQRGLSKYCTGRAMLEPELKRNGFKPRLRYIYKNITYNTN